jgi:hypothetical protein
VIPALVLVPILWMVDEGVQYRDVDLPEVEGYQWIVCVREYASPQIRCYAVDAENKIGFKDYDLKD